MSASDRFSILRLHLATLYHADASDRLLEAFGTAEDVFHQDVGELRRFVGRSHRLLDRLVGARTARLAEAEMGRFERGEVDCLVRGENGYPRRLAELPHAPLVLFVRGRLTPEDERCVGIVGSRRPSSYAARQSTHFARVLAPLGVTILSGFARGVDGRAHEAALDAGGRTLAVLGSGLGRIYPPEHAPLTTRILRQDAGALISEFPFDAAPRSFHFPQRNRLISGLCRTLLVVEAGEKSGSLITVRWALEQGKSVFVVPGRVDRPEAFGGLELLRDGAAVALGPEDMLRELGIRIDRAKRVPGDTAPRCSLGGEIGERLEELFAEEEEWHADAVAQRLTDVPAHRILRELSRLELEGRLARAAGGAYRRA